MIEEKVLTVPAAAALRDRFIGWQCRLRQIAVREAGGKPSPGMRPRVLSPVGEALAPAITVLIVPSDPGDSIKLFRYQVLRTEDPLERYDQALEFLAANYFQRPREFSDVMTALFAAESRLADELLALGRCRLDFVQYGQVFRLPCTVVQFTEDDEQFQATFWHNRLYNPRLPAGIRVLGFRPDWSQAS